MAILSKIRERSLFLIAIIGLALFAFVLDPSKIFNSSKVEEIGEINGETIDRKDFVKALEDYKTQTGNRVSEMQAAKTVWNNILRKKIYQKQLADAGITVGEEDVWLEIINAPSVKNNPQFKNEAGLFDEEKFKQFLADTKENNPKLWSAWSNYMNQIRDNAEKNTYNNLVTAGLGASLKEGENQYFNENTTIDARYVYVPYTSIVDSLVNVSKNEIKAYIKSHATDFEVDATRDISYVKFDIKPTTTDEEAIKKEVATLLDDRKEYSNVTKGEITVQGFKNTSDLKEFFIENGSDINLNSKENFVFKNQVSKEISEAVFKGNKGDVFGPYKDKGFFKISKITEVTQMPDSVKASHILIPFIGSRAATAETKQTEEQAKKTADSIVKIIKRNSFKFTALAKKFSKDKSNADKGGDLKWFTYSRMVPEFRDYAFLHKKGSIGVVKTAFGFHVIKIDDQKNNQKAVKLATFGRKIVPSEATENKAFQDAENFSLEVSKGDSFFNVARDKKYQTKTASGLKMLDENVSGIGKQRQIVSWAFNKDSNVGDFKRFDLENGYVVAFITAKINKGLTPVSRAASKIKPMLINKKKAKLINEKLKGSTLQELATATKIPVRNTSKVNLKSPTISGVGFEPNVVGAMYNATVGKVYKGIEGKKGVFSFKVIKKELPTKLPNYHFLSKQIAKKRKTQTSKVYDAIKNASDIEDNRASFYGIQ